MVLPEQRRLVDVAAAVLADEAQRLGISYAGFALTALPHKRLPDAEVWEKRGHNITLLVEPGRLRVGPGPAQLFGVPYGARARLILIYLQTEAMRTGSREVRLGRSMRAWMGNMGMAVGGESMRALRDHPVPLLESAIRQLNNRSMALDLYVWLAYRLHSLGRPTAISWTSLHAQFGSGFKLVRQFKPQFLDALAAATAAYPDARVEASESGITLHPSRPPVPKLA